MKVRLIVCSLLILSSARPAGGACAREKEGKAVEALFYNGRIITMDPQRPVAEAIYARGGRIAGVGSTEEIAALAGAGAERHDLKGMTVIPGLTDAHAHFQGYALSLANLDLSGTGSFEEILEMVRSKAAAGEKGKWISGRGWDQNDWASKDFPDRTGLDLASPDNPVLLVRVCGHAALANSAALVLAGIDSSTGDPEGGRIVRDVSGRPTGLLLDEAVSMVKRAIPPVSRAEKKRLFALAARNCLEAGLTGVHDMGIGSETASIYREMFDSGALPLRLTVYYNYDEEDLDSLIAAGLVGGYADDHYAVAGVKFFVDGSLGARSAALLEDYSDDPGNLGLLMMAPEELFRRIRAVHDRGFPVAVHAIGDRANRTILDIFEKLPAGSPSGGLRHRIEHAQVISPEDIGRFAGLGVIPSMQFVHCTSDMPWAAERLGEERLAGAYAWRSLIETGCRIPGGSDFPVESIDPFRGIYAAVTRMDERGNPASGWFPGQRLTVEEALRSFTLDAAWAARQEGTRGSIEKGKLADFVVISGDITSIDPARILEIEVIATVLGQEIVYDSGKF
ncbi:MAG: amidohydrolase [Candidatus Krumholzibacteria bacterium]|nr:amidohydrolase [Candidatus Krumholzibacteria bacterium]